MKEKDIATIAEEFEMQCSDVKTKWNAIHGQFGRELQKVKSNKIDQSNDELYTVNTVYMELYMVMLGINFL